MTARPLVTLDATSGSWAEPPWPSAFELARLLPPRSWTLVGGLMVQLHAALADLPSPRSTVDVDATLHLETHAVTFAQAAALLHGAGYVLDTETEHAYRFDRGHERVDVLCSDRHSTWRRPRFGGRPLFGVPGGTRALQQTIDVDMRTPNGPVRLVIPSVRGALVLKGAAYREDSRDRMRHAEDGVMLLACLEDPRDALSGLSQRSRGRIRSLLRALEEQTGPWANHDPVVQALARESFEELRHRLGS